MAEKKNAARSGAENDKKKALEAAMSQIEKAYGAGSVMVLGQNSNMNVDAVPTGSFSLDLALGVGGVPKGRIVEIYGPESSGKTTVALHIVAESQKLGGTAAFIDAEHALDPVYAKAVIIIGLIWRWTGYNMVFYLSAMQGIEYSIYEAARIDGANQVQQLFKITIPLLKPIILVTAIMSTSGTLQLFDESVNLTRGGPANMTITMSHYIYNTMFTKNPNFGYAAAMSFVILIMVAILSAIQTKVGDKR